MRRNLHLLLIILFTALLYSGSAKAQSGDIVPVNIKYLTWVTPINNPTLPPGYLTQIKDSSVMTSNMSWRGSNSISYEEIEVLKFRKKGSITSGAVLGVVLGFATVLALDSTSKDGPSGSSFLFGGRGPIFSGGEKTSKGAIGLIIPAGAIVGALIGSKKITIPINGKTKNQKQEIIKRLRF